MRPKSNTKRQAEIAVTNRGPLMLRGARNVRTISARFIADWEEDWEKHGPAIFEIMREKFPALYFQGLVRLAQVIRIEADVKHTFDKPRTVDEALAELESKVGAKGRKKFEKFLREVGADDEDEDVIDVEAK